MFISTPPFSWFGPRLRLWLKSFFCKNYTKYTQKAPVGFIACGFYFLYDTFKKVIKMWKYFLNNPTGRSVGDCAVRAVSVALGIDWEEAYILLADAGLQMGDLPNADATWGAVLRQHGFYRKAIPNFCPDCYTTADFAKDHPRGTYVLAFGGHVATVKDGVLLDAWNSSNLIPQYYFYRKDD